MFGSVLSFITSLNIESNAEEILSSLQISNLISVTQHMLIYFSLYLMSGELDELLDVKKVKGNMFENLMFPAIALQFALLISIIKNYRLRSQIAEAKGETSNAFLGATGLTTIFNAITQTTTTVCAGG
jgi:hypothetical protein